MTNFLLNLLPTIAGILLGICYVPQIIKTYLTKDVRSMSTAFWIILNVALTFLAINAVVVYKTSGVWGYMLTETFNEGLALVTLLMVLKYRKNDSKLNAPPREEFKGLGKIGFVVSGNVVSGNISGNTTSGNAQ